jgi:HSP20 family protein
MTALTTTRPTNGTALRGWNPVDEVLDNFFNDRNTGSNVTEHEDHYQWQIDMPGVAKENIDVEVSEASGPKVVSVSANQDTEDYQRRYSRSVRIGSGIDEEEISASYDRGVLTLHLPKRSREETTRKIEVQ